MRDSTYYVHRSVGTLRFREDGWIHVLCDAGIISYYRWLCRRYGFVVHPNKKYGPHISFIKGEPLPNNSLWGQDPGSIEFWYAHEVRRDNDCHAWLDVWSDDLIALRDTYGLPPKLKMSYHLTLGRVE